MTKRNNKTYTTEFKQGYSVTEVAVSFGNTTKLIYSCKAKLEAQQAGNVF